VDRRPAQPHVPGAGVPAPGIRSRRQREPGATLRGRIRDRDRERAVLRGWQPVRCARQLARGRVGDDLSPAQPRRVRVRPLASLVGDRHRPRAARGRAGADLGGPYRRRGAACAARGLRQGRAAPAQQRARGGDRHRRQPAGVDRQRHPARPPGRRVRGPADGQALRGARRALHGGHPRDRPGRKGGGGTPGGGTRGAHRMAPRRARLAGRSGRGGRLHAHLRR
jgi:hypothetical protein